ncbi:MAG TPA: HAD family phosphatase [Rhizobacter sp.]|nr:HAD family phosphatase [Rhizobacter sp.]
MNLALFDLDHTLIPFDSGMAWTRFLTERGVLPATAPDEYLAYCHQYVAGTLDIRAMHRATVAPLAAYTREQIAAWGQAFEAEMAARLPASMKALVRQHQENGDLCAIVTATESFIARPIARLFGIEHVVATEAQSIDGTPTGRLTGEIEGEPCYREHKLQKVTDWLRAPPLGFARGLGDFERSWFYSDSISDLALLSAVLDPVAVRPDARLRAHAEQAGWPVLD